MSSRVYLIHLSLLFALVLVVMPMPPLLAPYRPDWALLVLIYWNIALPQHVNVGVGFVIGFLVDVLLGSTLGTHALTFSIVAYISAANFSRIRNYSVWQQAMIVGMLSAFYHLTDYWLHFIFSSALFQPELMWPVLSNTILWPWAFFLLRRFRRKFKIH